MSLSSLPAGAKSTRGLSRTVVAWLFADVVVSLLSMASDLSSLLQRPLRVTDRALTTFMAVVGWAQLIVVLGTSFVVLKWIYRIYRNAQVLNPSLGSSPGWAIGWYFVPVANLWKPFGMLRDAWQVSAQPAAPSSVPTPPLLRGWWALWLISGFLGNVNARTILTSSAGLAGGGATPLNLGGEVGSIALDLVFIVIVRRLSAMQQAALAENVFD